MANKRKNFIREKRIYCGEEYLEVDIVAVTNMPEAGKGKKGKSSQAQKNLNDKRSKRRFVQIANTNFGTGLDKQLIGFRNGYGSSRPQFTAVCSLDIKTGKEEWGAEPGTEYYTLHIHEIRERKDC